MAGATRMTEHRNHERSHNSIGSTQAKNSLPIQSTQGSALAVWENFFKKENIAFRTDRKLHLPKTRDHNITIPSLLHFHVNSSIGSMPSLAERPLCREQGKLRTLIQNRHKKRHCRTFQYTRQGNIFSRLAYCQWSTEEMESGAAWKLLSCENDSFLDNDSLKRFHLPFNA